MRDYGIVSPRFWIGATGKSLRGDMPAQLLAMYLMTSPHSTMTGVYHCPVMYMGHETGLGEQGASEALKRLIEGGFCDYEEASETVFVIRMASFQIGESLKPGDNRVAGLRREVDRMAEPRIRARFLEVYGVAYHLVETTKKVSPHKAPCKPLPSQEQEQDQEQEQEVGAAPTPSAPAIIGIPLNTGSDFPITDDQLREFSELYPAVNVLQELRAMRGWCVANPAKRKTKSGVLRFVNGWLSKEQDSPGKRLSHAGNAQSAQANGNSVAASRPMQ